MKSLAFPKAFRIVKREEFVTMNRCGKRRHSRHFVAISRENDTGNPRLGITVSKKIGTAVERNRVKRLLREFFRLNRAKISKGMDIVIAAKRDAPLLNLEAVTRELGPLLLE